MITFEFCKTCEKQQECATFPEDTLLRRCEYYKDATDSIANKKDDRFEIKFHNGMPEIITTQKEDESEKVAWCLTRHSSKGTITKFHIVEMKLHTDGNNVFYGQIDRAIRLDKDRQC
jgi:hypothetical protein